MPRAATGRSGTPRERSLRRIGRADADVLAEPGWEARRSGRAYELLPLVLVDAIREHVGN